MAPSTDLLSLMAYAFDGKAAIIFSEVVAVMPRATSHATWEALEARLFNKDLIESQRVAFYAIRLRKLETVSKLAERIHDASVGLPELQGTSLSKDVLMKQKLQEALPKDLQRSYASIRQSHTLDSAAAILSQIQACGTERVFAATDGEPCTSDEKDLLQALRNQPSVVVDLTKEKGSAQNPVGPNPSKPADRIHSMAALICHNCRRHGHIQYQRICGRCLWDPLPGNGKGGKG